MSAAASTPAPLLPIPDPLTQFFWDGVAHGELRIQRCQQCRHYIHYPRPICRFCRSRELRGERVSGRASLYSWTISTQAFHPFWVARAPYTIATVELAEQPRLMFLSQVVGCAEAELRAGMPLEVSFERVAPELVLPFFRPAREGASR
jgi:uncharacterized OB-fold protein